MNLQEQRNDITRLAEQEKDPEGPACDENMDESADEFKHQKKSLAVFPGRVSTWIRNTNAFVADKRVGDLESVRKELDVAWERYDRFYENYIAKNLPEGELDRVKDRYTEIVVQYEECTIRINDCLTQMKKTSTSKQSTLKDLRRDFEIKNLILEQEQERKLEMERKKIELEFEKKKRACELKFQIQIAEKDAQLLEDDKGDSSSQRGMSGKSGFEFLPTMSDEEKIEKWRIRIKSPNTILSRAGRKNH